MFLSLLIQGLKIGISQMMIKKMQNILQLLMMTDEAKLNPINLTNDIIPRVMPYLYNSAKTYGKDGGNSLAKLLLSGLADVEADQWAKHRKIINHAFHVKKLKHMVPAFYISCSDMINKWEVLTKERSCAVDLVMKGLQSRRSENAIFVSVMMIPWGVSHDHMWRYCVPREGASVLVSCGIRMAKRVISHGSKMEIMSDLELEDECYEEILVTDDRLKGLDAFSEKRKP
ncbi:unnamed protein product [Lactuca saligna]|uniref:Uncharacterized protein n=1 Tax=Lactuca saligna TaxID=75948 RepID=A0AA35ZXH7_LACSI|nr:unnamed protein product [Lactuca saligna]